MHVFKFSAFSFKHTWLVSCFQAQAELLKAARQFQSAVGVYKAAKETVALAEERLCAECKDAAAQLSSAWQEMLNHALSKVRLLRKPLCAKL